MRWVGTLASPSPWPHERLAPPPTGDASVPTPLRTSPAFRGRFFITSLRKRLRPRRGGGGGCGGWGRLRRPRPGPMSALPLPQRATQASPLHSAPLPLSGGGFLSRRFGSAFVPVGAGVEDAVGGDACVA